MKDQGGLYTPSWNGVDSSPNQVAIRLKAGEALIRNGATIHTGHTVPNRERNTLLIGWSRWSGVFTGEPLVADARDAWQLDPAVREALLHEWMKIAWNRWAETQKLGDSLEYRYAGFDIKRIKAGQVVGWSGSWNVKLLLRTTLGSSSKPWNEGRIHFANCASTRMNT